MIIAYREVLTSGDELNLVPLVTIFQFFIVVTKCQQQWLNSCVNCFDCLLHLKRWEPDDVHFGSLTLNLATYLVVAFFRHSISACLKQSCIMLWYLLKMAVHTLDLRLMLKLYITMLKLPGKTKKPQVANRAFFCARLLKRTVEPPISDLPK